MNTNKGEMRSEAEKPRIEAEKPRIESTFPDITLLTATLDEVESHMRKWAEDAAYEWARVIGSAYECQIANEMEEMGIEVDDEVRDVIADWECCGWSPAWYYSGMSARSPAEWKAFRQREVRRFEYFLKSEGFSDADMRRRAGKAFGRVLTRWIRNGTPIEPLGDLWNAAG